jgi:hypothetical protein
MRFSASQAVREVDGRFGQVSCIRGAHFEGSE